jgi:hypothetical protein
VEFQWDSFAKITAAMFPEPGLVFRADFVRVSVKVKPRVAHSVAMRKRLVSCPGLVVFPVSRQADFPPRRVDFDFQIRGLRVLLVSASRLDWLLAKLPVPVVTRRALPLQPESLLDWPAPVSSTPDHEE